MKFIKKHLAHSVHRMFDVDQTAREFTLKKRDIVSNLLVLTIDFVHNVYIHWLIGLYGYPQTGIVGKKVMEQFWLLVQHQDFDSALQKACLSRCDFSPKHKAYLTDRILINEGKKQLFGTQYYRTSSGVLRPHPICDKKHLNERRKQAGLGDFDGYKNAMNVACKKVHNLR